jgi:hypothetical protein
VYVFFGEFVMLPLWRSSTSGISQIWLEIKLDSRNFLESWLVFFWRHI